MSAEPPEEKVMEQLAGLAPVVAVHNVPLPKKAPTVPDCPTCVHVIPEVSEKVRAVSAALLPCAQANASRRALALGVKVGAVLLATAALDPADARCVTVNDMVTPEAQG